MKTITRESKKTKIPLQIYGLILFLFFLSGLAGLVYQVIWSRLLILVFGASTPSIVAVSSAFMAGLALGSFLSRQYLKNNSPTLRTYAWIEIGIAVSSLFVPSALHFLGYIYAPFNYLSTVSQILKFLLTFAVLIVPTSLMGMTLPIVLDWIRPNKIINISRQVAGLYAANTFGAAAGAFVSAFFMIELFGLFQTLLIALAINLTIASVAWKFGRSKNPKKGKDSIATEINIPASTTVRLALAVFSLSGFIGMAYEIIWTRLLTPSTGSYVYAFSGILILILIGIAGGSFLYNYLSSKFTSPVTLLATTQLVIGVGAVLSLVFTGYLFNLNTLLMAVLALFPATIASGLTFPAISALTPTSSGASRFVAYAYGINTIGSMLGPIVTAYVLIPVFGSIITVIILSSLNLIFATILYLSSNSGKYRRISIIPLGLAALVFALLIIRPQVFMEKNLYELNTKFRADRNYNYKFTENQTASILGYNNPKTGDNNLLVDGIGMTGLLDETKLMAHIPILLHNNAKSMLIICFGMGTTYRSALSYPLSVSAVELVPDVPKLMPLFFSDGNEVLANKNGKIYIEDGRNFVKYSPKKFDIVQIDPPPPVNSAGTTILYSREFYDDIKRKLNPAGLVLQWIYFGSRQEDIFMLINTFRRGFENVTVFRSPNNMGIFLIGSDKPVKVSQTRIAAKLKQYKEAAADLSEWHKWDAGMLSGLQVKNPEFIFNAVSGSPIISDNYPRTEYFLLRHYFAHRN